LPQYQFLVGRGGDFVGRAGAVWKACELISAARLQPLQSIIA
jgi:hypothetical protein